MKKKRKHCVELAKTIAKTRDGYRCLRCGKSKEAGWQIQASHIKGEGAYPNLSYRSRNIKALCADCHRWWHSAPTDSGIWFKEKYPQWFEEIDAMKKEPVGQPNYDKIYDGLKEELRTLQE